MVTPSFLYNAIFCAYALVWWHLYHIAFGQTGYYFFPFAADNLTGRLVLGPLFDTLGSRKMILLISGLSGILLAISGALFDERVLNVISETVFWSAILLFFASAGASSAYLPVSEIFPLELRAQAISFFLAISQLAGGVAAPTLFAAPVGNGHHTGRWPPTFTSARR